MQNRAFRSLFFQRLCDYMNFGYAHDKVADILQQFDDLTNTEFKNDYARWSKEMDDSLDKISISNPEMGELWVNGYLVKSEAVYFSGMEMQISILAKKDYNLIGWTEQSIEPFLDGSLKLEDFGEISPVFE